MPLLDADKSGTVYDKKELGLYLRVPGNYGQKTDLVDLVDTLARLPINMVQYPNM